MFDVRLILGASVVLQVLAAALAFRLIGVTGRRWAWALIASAISLMAVRRAITCYRMFVDTGGSIVPDPAAELVALGISALMLLGVACIAPLFTTMMRSEQARREAEQRYRVLATMSPVGIFHADAEGRCVHVNDRWCELAGMSAGDAKDRGWAAAIHPEERARVAEQWDSAVRRQEPFQTECRLQRPDGEVAYVFAQAVSELDEDGEGVGYVGTLTDITERRIMEEALRKNEARLANAQRVARMGFWDWDILNDDLYWSDEIYPIFGLSPDRFGASYEAFIELVHSDDRAMVQRHVEEALRHDTAYDIDHRILHPMGEVRHVHEHGEVTRDGHGRPIRMFGTVVDVTDRKRSEQKFRDLLECAPDAIVIVESSGRIKLVNAQAEAIFGHGRDEMLNQPVEMLMPERFRAGHPARLASYFDEPSRRPMGSGLELSGLRENGTEFPIEIGLSPIETEEGTLVSVVIRDITERKKAEESLRSSEKRYRDLFQHAPIAVLEEDFSELGQWLDQLRSEGVKDISSYLERNPDALGRAVSLLRLRDANQAAVDLFGARDKSELVENLHRIFTKETHESFAAELGALWNGETKFEAECTARTLAGERIDDVMRWFVPSESGRPDRSRVVVSLVNITARKRSEEALRESESRFRQLAESIDQVFWLTDWVDRRLLYVSPAYETLFGLSCASLHVDRHSWADIVHPDDRARVKEAFARGADLGRLVEEEYQIIRPDGSVRWVRDRAFPIFDDTGKVVRIAGLADDITKRRQAEEAAGAAQAQLAHASRLRTMGEMTSAIAHEVNQPLAAIANFANGCVRRIQAGTISPADLLEPAKQVAAEARRASEIISRIRGFVKRRSPRRTMVSLNDMVRDAVGLAELEARRSGITIRLELADGLPPVQADAIELQQVILNLIRNGCEAIERESNGERIVRVRTLRSGDGQVEVAVVDSGCGLPEGEVGRVLEPFFTTKDDGMGMGLSICRSIVETYGGRLTVMPVEPSGTVSRFTLPVRGGVQCHES